MRIVHRVLLAISVLLVSSVASYAGPYFNTARKEVDELSRLAVRDLSEGRIRVISMLTELDMGNLDKARNLQLQAVELIVQAYKRFREIETKVPQQPLNTNLKSEQERKVLEEFYQVLERRGLPRPRTEKDLAVLTIVVTERYLNTVAKAPLDGFPRNWQGVRAIILSEVELLSIGNLVSVVWTINQQQ